MACGSRQHTASPGQGGLQLTQWPLVSTVGLYTNRPAGLGDCDGPGTGSRCPRRSWSGRSLFPESCPHPEFPSQHVPTRPGEPDAPSFRRPSWATAPRTCTSSATAWARTRPRRRAGGWRAAWAGSQVGARGSGSRAGAWGGSPRAARVPRPRTPLPVSRELI